MAKIEKIEKPRVWKMVKEAVAALGGTTTSIAVRDWILKKYSGTNPTPIGCHIIVSTVNHSSRNFSIWEQ